MGWAQMSRRERVAIDAVAVDIRPATRFFLPLR